MHVLCDDKSMCFVSVVTTARFNNAFYINYYNDHNLRLVSFVSMVATAIASNLQKPSSLILDTEPRCGQSKIVLSRITER